MKCRFSEKPTPDRLCGFVHFCLFLLHLFRLHFSSFSLFFFFFFLFFSFFCRFLISLVSAFFRYIVIIVFVCSLVFPVNLFRLTQSTRNWAKNSVLISWTFAHRWTRCRVACWPFRPIGAELTHKKWLWRGSITTISQVRVSVFAVNSSMREWLTKSMTIIMYTAIHLLVIT